MTIFSTNKRNYQKIVSLFAILARLCSMLNYTTSICIFQRNLKTEVPNYIEGLLTYAAMKEEVYITTIDIALLRRNVKRSHKSMKNWKLVSFESKFKSILIAFCMFVTSISYNEFNRHWRLVYEQDNIGNELKKMPQ